MPSFVHETNNNPSDNPAINQNDKLTLIAKNGGVPDKIEIATTSHIKGESNFWKNETETLNI